MQVSQSGPARTHRRRRPPSCMIVTAMIVTVSPQWKCNLSKYNFSEPSHKSHNTSGISPTMQHFVTEMWTFLLQNGAIGGYGIGALWDLYNRSNRSISQIPQFIRHLSHNAPFCNRRAKFFKNGAMWNICLVHCGRCEMGLYMIFSQHCRYWWPGASATEHQQTHCWLHTQWHCIFSSLCELTGTIRYNYLFKL